MKAQAIIAHTLILFSFIALSALLLFASASLFEFSAFNNFVVVPTLLVILATVFAYINEKVADKFIA